MVVVRQPDSPHLRFGGSGVELIPGERHAEIKHYQLLRNGAPYPDGVTFYEPGDTFNLASAGTYTAVAIEWSSLQSPPSNELVIAAVYAGDVLTDIPGDFSWTYEQVAGPVTYTKHRHDEGVFDRTIAQAFEDSGLWIDEDLNHAGQVIRREEYNADPDLGGDLLERIYYKYNGPPGQEIWVVSEEFYDPTDGFKTEYVRYYGPDRGHTEYDHWWYDDGRPVKRYKYGELVFDYTYLLETIVSPEPAGIVRCNPDAGGFPSGQLVQLTAVANYGYEFDHWEGHATGPISPAQITMNADKSVTAVFVEKFISPADLTLDSDVDTEDLIVFSESWLTCNDPNNPACGSSSTAPQPMINSPDPGLWCEFNDDYPTYGTPYSVCGLWDYTTEPGIGTTLAYTDRNTYWVTDADGVPAAMETDQDWVVRLVMRRNNIPVSYCNKVLEIGTAIRVDYLSLDGITLAQDISYMLSNFTNEVFHTLTFHYKAANSRIDVWLDDVLEYADIEKLSDGSYDIAMIQMRGKTSYDDLMIGQLQVYLPADLDEDHYVSLPDFIPLASDWLEGVPYLDEFGNTIAGWWKFDDGAGSLAADASGYDYHGNITGGTWTTGYDGGGALDFSVGSYVAIPLGAFATIDDEITITFWQNGDSAVQPQGDYLFEGRDVSNNRVLGCHLPWGDGVVYWDAGNDGASYDRVSKATTAPSQYEGQWNHWALTKNTNTGYMRIYLNGQPWYSAGPGYTRNMQGIAAFKIGARVPTDYNYDGAIDDFRVYNHELTPADIMEIYAP